MRLEQCVESSVAGQCSQMKLLVRTDAAEIDEAILFVSIC